MVIFTPTMRQRSQWVKLFTGWGCKLVLKLSQKKKNVTDVKSGCYKLMQSKSYLSQFHTQELNQTTKSACHSLWGATLKYLKAIILAAYCTASNKSFWNADATLIYHFGFGYFTCIYSVHCLQFLTLKLLWRPCMSNMHVTQKEVEIWTLECLFIRVSALST